MGRKPQKSLRAEAATDRGAGHTTPGEAPPISVVLLSDLPLVAWGLARLIESGQPALAFAGTTHDIESTLRLMKQQPVDVILVDLDGELGATGIPELLDGGRTRVLAVTTSRDPEFCDAAVLAGASGIVNKRDPVEALLKAVDKVHAGEFWLDRVATGRIFVAMARQRAAKDPEQDKIAGLTRKERLTVSETARDASASSREIAQRLCISEHTLRNHLTSIYAKLGLSSRVELYAYANKHKLIAAGGVRQTPAAGRAEPVRHTSANRRAAPTGGPRTRPADAG
jgi:two-component system, NarL family, nitrate/nitrite response regulator NarL